METGINSLFDDYAKVLAETKKQYNNLKVNFKEFKQANKEFNDYTLGLFELGLKSLSNKLIQMLYLLMKCYINIINMYSKFNEEKQQLIDEYYTLTEKVGKLISEVREFANNFIDNKTL